MDESVEFNAHRVGGLKKTMLSGEGYVVTFTGPGTVYLQTRDYDTSGRSCPGSTPTSTPLNVDQWENPDVVFRT